MTPGAQRFSVRPVETGDRAWVEEVVAGWGAEFIVSRGRKVYPQKLPGFLAIDTNDVPIGLATYEIIDEACELVTLDALRKFVGVGSSLVEAVVQIARAAQCARLWLITLNDNLDAIRFYQRRGFTICAVHTNAMDISRKIKPSIPKIGQFGIPLRDEIEFEMALGANAPK